MQRARARRARKRRRQKANMGTKMRVTKTIMMRQRRMIKQKDARKIQGNRKKREERGSRKKRQE